MPTTMLVRRKLATLVTIDIAGWQRVPDLTRSTEACALTARFSDGRTVERSATIEYAPGERERILEAVMSGEGTEREVQMAQAILYRRAQALQKTLGEMQREFAGGLLPAELA